MSRNEHTAEEHKMPTARYLPVHIDPKEGRPVAGLDVDRDDPGAWHLTWFRPPEELAVFRTAMRRAETAVLPQGGEIIRFRAPENCPGIAAELDGWPAAERIGNDEPARWVLTLMLPGEDGLIHEDEDDRTPLDRITCPTCVQRIAESRTRRRQQTGPEGPRGMAQHSQRIAEAYARLAETERELALRPVSSGPDARYPEPGPEIRERFNTLADQWERETMFLSSPRGMARHPAHRAIVDLGAEAVRPLLERLEEQGGFWSIALREITGENDLIRPEERGRIEQIRLRWLDWGWQHGLLPPTPSRPDEPSTQHRA